MPIVAMKSFRGGALAANLASTIIRALGVVAVRVVVLRVTRLGALFLGGLPDGPCLCLSEESSVVARETSCCDARASLESFRRCSTDACVCYFLKSV